MAPGGHFSDPGPIRGKMPLIIPFKVTIGDQVDLTSNKPSGVEINVLWPLVSAGSIGSPSKKNLIPNCQSQEPNEKDRVQIGTVELPE